MTDVSRCFSAYRYKQHFDCDPSKSVSDFSRNYRVSGERLRDWIVEKLGIRISFFLYSTYVNECLNILIP